MIRGEISEDGFDDVFTHNNWNQPPRKKRNLNTSEQSSSPIPPSPQLTQPLSMPHPEQPPLIKPLSLQHSELNPLSLQQQLTQLLKRVQQLVQPLSSTHSQNLSVIFQTILELQLSIQNQPQDEQVFLQIYQHIQLVQKELQDLEKVQQQEKIKNLIKDEDAIKILLTPETIVQGELFCITDFLKRMHDEFKQTPKSEFKNLRILMASEISSQQNEFITLEQFNHFLLRFGPLSQCLEKIRDFVNAGAADWFHGNVTREESEVLLKTAFKKENCTHFLIRSVPIQLINDTNYVFAVSFIQGAVVYHSRIYTDKKNRFCQVREVLESSLKKQKKEVLKDFQSYLELTLKLKQGDHCKPVTCSYFSSLHKEYPHLSEQDIENGYVVTSESIK